MYHFIHSAFQIPVVRLSPELKLKKFHSYYSVTDPFTNLASLSPVLGK